MTDGDGGSGVRVTDGPVLSVVVACTPRRNAHAAAVEPPWLTALRRSCAGLDAEIVVVGAATRVAADDLACVVLPAPTDSLVPIRWAVGIEAAHGTVIAFTTDLCVVHPGWARAALAAIARGAAAVGGPLTPGAGLTRTDRAVYHLRFGALPDETAGCIDVPDVAADNAAYHRATLLKVGGSFAAGFWEIEANRRLRAAGHPLVFCGDMRAEFVGGEALLRLARQRGAHGRQAGAWRVAVGARRAWQVALAAPLVPLVLLARAMRRQRARRNTHGASPVAVAPEFLVLASAWAAGEAAGALAGAPGAVRRR